MTGGRIERRLAAVLAADVAGYSRLMGLDEVGTARTLREHRAVTDALVAKHGGRIVKTTGDGVLLEFPSVVDAVECAVAVQAVMDQRNEGVPVDRRMFFRIGFKSYDDIVDHCCYAWNTLIAQPWKIMSIALRDWAYIGRSF